MVDVHAILSVVFLTLRDGVRKTFKQILQDLSVAVVKILYADYIYNYMFAFDVGRQRKREY